MVVGKDGSGRTAGDEGAMLVPCGGGVPSGRSLALISVGPRPAPGRALEYTMVVRAGHGALSLSAAGPVQCTRRWAGPEHLPPEGFLFVPDAYWSSSGSLSVTVHVKKLVLVDGGGGRRVWIGIFPLELGFKLSPYFFLVQPANTSLRAKFRVSHWSCSYSRVVSWWLLSAMAMAAVAFHLPAPASATYFWVGDEAGWTLNYTIGWPENKTFNVDDYLVFKYAPGNYTVLEVDSQTFKDCYRQGNTINEWFSGNDTVKLDKPGRRWFFSAWTTSATWDSSCSSTSTAPPRRQMHRRHRRRWLYLRLRRRRHHLKPRAAHR